MLKVLCTGHTVSYMFRPVMWPTTFVISFCSLQNFDPFYFTTLKMAAWVVEACRVSLGTQINFNIPVFIFSAFV